MVLGFLVQAHRLRARGKAAVIQQQKVGVAMELRRVNGVLLTGAPALTTAVTVRFGGTTVTPSFAGLSATGLYQINVQVPSTATGDVPVVATIGGVSSPGAFIAVQP